MGASGGSLPISARNRIHAGDGQGADLSRIPLQSFELDELQGVAATRHTIRADIEEKDTLVWESISQIELADDNLVTSLGFLCTHGLPVWPRPVCWLATALFAPAGISSAVSYCTSKDSGSKEALQG